MLKSLNIRFSALLLNEDVILVSTFLDPRLGIFSFEDDKKDIVKEKVKKFLVKQ